jgi:hypothetical protein
MKKMRFLLGFLVALGIVLFTGCQELENVDNIDLGKGTLVIKITDAPFPYDDIYEAIVVITKVEIRKYSEGEEHGEENGEENGDENGDENGYPYLTIWEGEEEFNLLELRGGITAELAQMEIDAGHYDLIRLYVSEARLVVKDEGGNAGETFTMKVPSGAQTGIKVFMKPPLYVATSLTTDVVLDFDLEKSFVVKGNPDTPAGIKGFNFKPVVKALNSTTDGTLAGEVFDSETDALLSGVSVWIKEDETKSGTTDGEGYYEIDSIPAGFYDAIAALDGYYNDTVEVEIIEGNLTTQDFTLTPITILEGVVKESGVDGPLLVGAKVWIEQEKIKIDSALTNGEGKYVIDSIDVGTYDVIASFAGYVNDTAKNLDIVVGINPPLDFELVKDE